MKPSDLRTSLTLRTGLVLLLASCFLVALRAADTVESALQRGLVAEEAQRDLRAAAEAYQQAVRLGDQQREAQATAIYRLGEVQRRLGNSDAARLQFVRILTEFPDQTNLVALARNEVPQTSPASAQEPLIGQFLAEAEFQRDTAALQLAKLDKAIANFQTANRSNLVQILAFRPNRLLETLLADLNVTEQQRAKLSPDFGPQHPEMLRINSLQKAIDQQLQDVAQGIKAALIEEQATTALQVARLEGRVTSLKELQRAAQQNPRNADIVDLVTTAPQTMSPEEAEELERLKKLAAESPDLLRKARGRSAPLQNASEKGWTNVVSYLLDQGVPIDDGFPLHRAAELGNLTLVSLLLERGADPNTQSPLDGTPLHSASRTGRRAVAEKLIKNGAQVDPHTQGEEKENPISKLESLTTGNTPLHLAAYNGMPAVVELLLEKGASLESTNSRGMTPLFAALMGRQNVTFQQLIDAGSDMAIAGMTWKQGEDYGSLRTMLHVAAADGERDIVKLLLRYGVNPHSTDSWGKTPLHYAQNSEVALALIDAGAQVNAKSLEGRTPLDELQQGPFRRSSTAKELVATLGGTNANVSGSQFPYQAARITGELIAQLDLEPGTSRPLRNWIGHLSIEKSADLTRVSIRRPIPNGFTNWMVDLTNTNLPDTKIIAGDWIYVPARPVKK